MINRAWRLGRVIVCTPVRHFDVAIGERLGSELDGSSLGISRSGFDTLRIGHGVSLKTLKVNTGTNACGVYPDRIVNWLVVGRYLAYSLKRN